MSTLFNGSLLSTRLAVFETLDDAPHPRGLLTGMDRLSIETLPDSPAGYAWFALAVPEEPKSGRSSIAASALQRLGAAAEKGQLPGFRIVHGAYLMEYHASIPPLDVTGRSM